MTTTSVTGASGAGTTSGTSAPAAAPGSEVVAPVSPSEVLVEVLNGFGANGAATAAAAALHQQGFAINGTGNASSFEYADNVIQYAPGELAGASTLEAYVTGTTQVVESDQVPAGEVQLMLGSTYDGIADN